MMPHPETLHVYEQLQVGDQVELEHEVKVGFRSWTTTTQGTVVRKERQRHSLHFQRNFDDKVYRDLLVLRREDGELTTLTLDEFSQLRRLSSAASSPTAASREKTEETGSAS
jgi:hypothetical protein